jgi:hypothetical protein
VRRADQIGAVVLFGFGVWFALTAAQHYPYWGPNGPGSGFFPVWLGAVMASLAVLLFVAATRARDPGSSWLPTGRGARRLGVVLVVTALLIGLLNVVGMILGTGLFLVVLLRFVERYSWRLTLAVAVSVSAVNWLVFTYWLLVPFPVGVLGF